MKKLAPLLLCSSALLTACATTSGASPPSPEVRTEFIDRPINAELFEDRGVPAVGGLSVTEDDQTDASVQVAALGAALADYRCRLNAAGVALVPGFPRLPECVAGATPNE